MKPRTLPLLLGLLTLAACSSDDDTFTGVTIPTAPVAITSSNAQKIASESVQTQEAVSNLGDSTGSVVTGVALSPQQQADLITVTHAAFLHAYTAPLTSASSAAGVVASPVNNVSCSSGSASVTFSDINFNNQWDQGEGARVSYSSCVVPVGGINVTLNGSVAITLSELTGDPSSGSSGADWSFTIAVTYEELSLTIGTIGAVSFDGDVALAVGYATTTTTQSASLSGSSMTRTITVSNQRYAARLSNFLFDVSRDLSSSTYTWNADYTLASTRLDGSITVVTDPVFAGIEGSNPTQGIMTITGANNSALRLDADTGDEATLGIWLDENGDGTFAHFADVGWDNL